MGLSTSTYIYICISIYIYVYARVYTPVYALHAMLLAVPLHCAVGLGGLSTNDSRRDALDIAMEAPCRWRGLPVGMIGATQPAWRLRINSWGAAPACAATALLGVRVSVGHGRQWVHRHGRCSCTASRCWKMSASCCWLGTMLWTCVGNQGRFVVGYLRVVGLCVDNRHILTCVV